MNKWSLLLFSVLGLLLSTTSELNFVDGRRGCCDYSSRPLLSDTRLSIDEPHCAYRTFTEVSQLISPKRDIPYDTRNLELKRSSRAGGHRRQFDSNRNVLFDLDHPTLSSSRDRKVLRVTKDLYLRKQVKSFPSDNFREKHVYRLSSRNNDIFGERNSRERRFNIEEEIRTNRFRYNDGPVSVNLKARNQIRFYRGNFVTRTYIMPNQREIIGETTLSFTQKNEVKRDMERSNLDTNSRQRLFSDIRLTSCLVDLSKNTERSNTEDDRIVRKGNIRDYRRLPARDDSTVKMYERESLTKVRRNIEMDGPRNFYRRSYDEDISVEEFPGFSSRPRSNQKEREGSRNRIREDKKQTNKGSEKRLFEEEEQYATRGLSRQNSNINRIQEIRQARFHKNVNVKHAEDYSNVFVERVERASDESGNRRFRENNCAIRLNDEYTVDHITPPNKNSIVEKETVSTNINRRGESVRRSVLEHRGREDSRFRLEHENGNISGPRRIRQIRNGHNEDKERETRNSQRTIIRSNAMGREIKNIMQIYDHDNVFQGSLVRKGNNRELVNNLEHERLSRTGKGASQIRIIQHGNQKKMHILLMDIQEPKILEDPIFNKRFFSNINRNAEKRRSRTYNEKSEREQFRNSLVHETKEAFDESRVTQIRDKHEYRRAYRLNAGRTGERVLARTDSNGNNIVERGFLSIIPSIGNTRLYGIIRSAVSVLRRREIYEVRYRSARENEKNFEQWPLRSENKRSFDERRNSRLRDTRKLRFNDKVSAERVFVRNINKNIEKRESMTRPEFNVNHHTQTKRTIVLLQFREIYVPSLLRLNERHFEVNGNGIIRNRQFTSIEDRNSNIRMAQISHELGKINVKSNTRGTRDKVTSRYVESKVEFQNSEETHHERRTGKVIRSMGRHALSINNRDLLEVRSEERRNFNRKLEYIRYVRSYNGPENSAYRIKYNARTSDRDNNRERDLQDMAREGIRVSNGLWFGLQLSNKQSRITKNGRANKEEQEMIAVFSKIPYLSNEHKTQSDNKIFQIKLPYIFYILQGLYILGVLTKFTENSKGIQKRRFSNRFLPFRTAL